MAEHVINPATLGEAIKTLEDLNIKNTAYQEKMPRMIATLAVSVGWKTMTSKYLPKGVVMIGDGEGFKLNPLDLN